jgi:hypothetical protein
LAVPPSDAFTCDSPITSVSERRKFEACDELATYMEGKEPGRWDVGDVGPGWALGHDDVPTRPDKVGYLFSYEPGKGMPQASAIEFTGVQTTAKTPHVSLGYLRTYGDGFGKVSCRVDEGIPIVLDPYWEFHVSLLDWILLPAAPGTHTVTCTADLADSGRDLSKPWFFKILAVASC